MPTTQLSRHPPNRRRRHLNHRSSSVTNPETLTTLTLAALSFPQNPSSKPLLNLTTTKLLHLLHHNHHTSSSLLNSILSLLPLLLRSHCAATAARIVGAVALLSIDANETIASDTAIVKPLLLWIVSCDNKKDKMDACNAVLDLCTTRFARDRLLDQRALDYLMLGFLQVQKSLTSSVSMILVEKKGDPCLGVALREDELRLVFIDAIVTLTNCCNTEQLKRIPRTLVEVSLTYLKELWSKVREQLLDFSVSNTVKGRCCHLSSLTSYNLAESLFRLSLIGPSNACPMASDFIIRHLFGPLPSSFNNFVSEHWELSPFLMMELPKELDLWQDIFSVYMSPLTNDETVSRFLSSTLRGTVSCPAFALNEIDILSFLNDVRNTIGCPITYQQDIRVVRTNLRSKSEEHYFQECSYTGNEEGLRSFSIDDILKCEIAYREGYTIALRGMEFRVKSIADIAREVASLFGQPSVGANLYITPPNSQGLACHFDDHCVFVCQLRGTKQWTVFPQPTVQLPRLYDQLEIPQDPMVKSRQIMLREGEVLYIPRGFAHEAHTGSGVGTSGKGCDFSVHLTLAVEVEPPFEWEGFAHIALCCWSHYMEYDKFSLGSSWSLQAISVSILHVAIRLISYAEPLFRKACLVAASSLPPKTKEWLEENQKSMFKLLTSKIHELASFTDALEFVKLAIQRNEDPFHWLRWLEHLDGKKDLDHNVWKISDQILDILPFIYQHKDDAKAAFANVKSDFCSKTVFDDAKENFVILHALYKEARLQYMNGMLSLHC